MRESRDSIVQPAERVTGGFSSRSLTDENHKYDYLGLVDRITHYLKLHNVGGDSKDGATV